MPLVEPPVLFDRRNTSEYRLLAAARSGTAVRILPGVYAPVETAGTVRVRCAAVCRHDPTAIILGYAAAAVSWWPDLAVEVIEARRRGNATRQRGFRWSQRALPATHVIERDGIRLVNPALSVLDLIPSLGGRAIDEVLRRRAATLDELWTALAATKGRPGHQECRRLLLDSRDEPWSEAERELHRIVRKLRLPWRYATNYRVVGDRVSFLDLALPELRLGFEVDGYAHHCDRAAFEHDRARDLDLERAGWLIHRFSAEMIFRRPEWTAETLTQLARARGVLRRRRAP